MVTRAGGLFWNQGNFEDHHIKHICVFILSLNHCTFLLLPFLNLCYILGTKLSMLCAFCMVSCSVNFSCWLFATPWIAARQASLSINNSWSLVKLMSLSRWCHPTISCSVVPFFSCLQSFPVTQLCPTFCSPMDCSPPGSSVHWIFLAWIVSQLPLPTPFDALCHVILTKFLWFILLLSTSISEYRTSLVSQMVKASAYNVGDPGLIPGLGRSPGEGNGNLLQYSCLENPMDGGAWWAAVHGVAKSQTWLNDFTYKWVNSFWESK